MTGGVRRSVRERGKGAAGLGWFGVSWAGWLPGAAQVAAGSLPLYFFSFCFLFLLFLKSVLGFEKGILFRFE
jgi:hypothetical protein